MRTVDSEVIYSATDLVHFLGCEQAGHEPRGREFLEILDSEVRWPMSVA